MSDWKEDFKQLVALDSVSFQERGTADWLLARLQQMGFTCSEDDAGKHYGGNAGNVFGTYKGTLPGAPILLSAHMDVVDPGIGKTAIFEADGTIHSDGTTVLGSDDIAGIVEILHGIEYLQEHQIPHRDIEVLFPIGEERYIKGTDQFDFSRVKAKTAYVLDLSGDVGAAARKAPSIISFRVKVQGKASHAGFSPETGIHAIAAAAEAVTKLQMGRLEEGVTLNVGTIQGGIGTNIVPELCECTGEIRSFSHERALQLVAQVGEVFEQAAKSRGAKAELSYEVHLVAYEVAEDASIIQQFQNACGKLGLEGAVGDTFGGSDNNNFVKNGLEGLVLSCGMNAVHSVQEYTSVQEIEKGIALVAELLQQPE